MSFYPLTFRAGDVESKIEIAVSVSSDLFYGCVWTLGGGPLERNVCQLYTRYCESSKSLEGDCGRDRVRRCRV